MDFIISEEKPIFRQLIEYIEQMILNSEIKPNEPLPSVRTLAVELSINPQTILKALQDLMNREIVYKKRGQGMYVSENARQLIIDEKKNSFLDKQVSDFLKYGMSLDLSKEELLNCIQKNMKDLP